MKFKIIFFVYVLQQIITAQRSSSSKESENENRDGVLSAENNSLAEENESDSDDEVLQEDKLANHFEEAGSLETSQKKEVDPQFEIEKEAGDQSYFFGSNQHYSFPTMYKDFGRRFVLQYPYSKTLEKNEDDESRLLPKKAPPELVMSIAKESAQLEASKPINPTDEVIKKEILRTGKYWNAVWVEEVDPKQLLRSKEKHKVASPHKTDATDSHLHLKSIKTKIIPGSKIYQLISVLKQFSPKLLYVINDNH